MGRQLKWERFSTFTLPEVADVAAWRRALTKYLEAVFVHGFNCVFQDHGHKCKIDKHTEDRDQQRTAWAHCTCVKGCAQKWRFAPCPIVFSPWDRT